MDIEQWYAVALGGLVTLLAVTLILLAIITRTQKYITF